MTGRGKISLLLFAALVAMVAHASTGRSDMPAIVQEAFDNMPPVLGGWAYTRETVRGGSSRIEDFDPRLQPAWRLLSVDGRAPTTDELATYAEEIGRREGRNPPGENDFAGLAEHEGWETLEETAERVSYRFRPRPEAFDNRAPADRLLGELTILKSVPYVESFRLYNTKPFRVKLVAKIEHIETEIEMQRLADRTYMPAAVFTTVRGGALGLKRIDETVTLRYSEFRYVGASAAAD